MKFDKKKLNVKDFIKRLQSVMIEKDVEAGFDGFLFKPLGIKHYGTVDKIFQPYFCEFKEDGKLDRKGKCAARVFAQVISELHEAYEENSGNIDFVTNYVLIADKHHVIVLPIELFKPMWQSTKYTFTTAHATYNELLDKDVLDWDIFKNCETIKLRKDTIDIFLNVLENTCGDFRGHNYMKINRKNFKKLFLEWKRKLGINKGIQLDACLFLQDIAKKAKLFEEENRLYFFDDNMIYQYVDINVHEYKNFWSHYQRPVHPHEHEIILSYKDQLIHMNERWKTGEFFTPYEIVEKSYDKLLEYYKMDPLELKEYTFWDPCCGQGNLLHSCPGPYNENQHFLSTKNQGDIDIMNQNGSYIGAKKFMFDFLNQTYDELPNEIKLALADKSRKWLFVMNPPWGSNCSGQNFNRTSDKKDTNSITRTNMAIDNLSKFSTDLMYQCFYRLIKMITDHNLNAKIIFIGNWNVLFTTRTEFRSFLTVNNMHLQTGFLFDGNTYFGTTQIPFACSLIYERTNIKSLDVINLTLYKKVDIGHLLYETTSNNYLWHNIKKLECTTIGYQLNKDNLSILNQTKKPIEHICYFGMDTTGLTMYLYSQKPLFDRGLYMSDINCKHLALLTLNKFVMNKWYYGGGGTYHIFDKVLQFNDTLNTLIYLAFHKTYGRTTSFSEIYNNEEISIRNPFFWITKEEFVTYNCINQSIYNDLKISENSWFINYLQEHQLELHPAAKEILHLATEITKETMCYRGGSTVIHPKKGKDGEKVKSHLDTRWDAGWYQIVRGIIENPNIDLPDNIKELYKQYQLKMVELESYLREVAKGLKLTDEVILYGK